MRVLVFLALFTFLSQSLMDSGIAAPLDDSYKDDARLLKLKKKKLRKLCSLLNLVPRNAEEAEARTLVFLQVQQIQSSGPSYPGGGSYPLGDSHGASNICSNLGGGGGEGGLLGGLLGSILGNPQSDPINNLNSPALFSNAADFRPQRYLRPTYRTIRTFFPFFKK